MVDEVKHIVAAGYDAAARRYAGLETESEQWPRMRWLRDLLDRLPDGCDVLDLGCGSGLPAPAEIAKRHRITGVDVSAAQVALARRNVPGGVFLCADAAEVDFAAESFDAVVSFYAFDHIPRDQHRSLFARICRWLRPGGLLLVSIEDADQPGTVGQWLGVQMFFSMFDATTTRGLVEEAGFTLQRTAVELQTEQGREVPYLWILARKGIRGGPPEAHGDGSRAST